MTTQTEEAPPAAEEAGEAHVLIGARLREAERIHHFIAPAGSDDPQIYPGDYIVVDRGHGEIMARVATVGEPSRTTPARNSRYIIRLADAEDRERAAQSQQIAERVLADMRRLVAETGIGIYPVAVEPNLDATRATAHFHAENHVDFRDLVEELEALHEIDIDMQHAGPRERAKLVDGHDICGLRLCCASWMTEFPKVGIRQAKAQDLSLNPDTISGVCGRIFCCLTFEHDVYREMRGTLPKLGKRVSTPAGMGKVVKLNVLKQTATIRLDDHPERVDVPAAEIGLTVRTEDAPNQAAIDAEREEAERASALRQAAAPAGAEIEQPEREPAAPTDDAPQRRRRRRRQESEPTEDGSPQPRQRRERSQPAQKRERERDAEPSADPGNERDRERDHDGSPQRRRRRRAPTDREAPPADRPRRRPDAPSARDSAPAESESPRPRRRRRRRPADGQEDSSDD